MNKPSVQYKAVLLVALMVLVGPSTLVKGAPTSTSSGEITITPTPGNESVLANISSVVQVPANHSITGGALEIQTEWTPVADMGSYYGAGYGNGWLNGTFDNTSSLAHGGKLSLSTDTSLGTLADFESTTRVPTGWLGMGPDSYNWTVVNVTTLQGQEQPSSASNGVYSLAFGADHSLTANMTSCILSPRYSTPEVVRNLSLSFDHWRSFTSNDALWVEYTFNDADAWNQLIPTDGYNTTVSTSHPSSVQSYSSVWSGSSLQWDSVHFQLDNLANISLSQSMRFRMCADMSDDLSQRGGWFIDNLTWYNQGDEPGSWFHGNLSGDYAPNADGTLVMPVNFSGLASPIELEVRSNWDIEGGSNDGMTIWYSLDNGTSWVLLTPLPGLPGNGVAYQGQFYVDESFGWLPMFYPVSNTVSNHSNASHGLLKFNVQTDSIVNHGGSAPAVGWEGIMIDDVTLHSGANTATPIKRVLNNFTSIPDYTNGSIDGWLDNVSAPNQWQWVSTMGVNGPRTAFDSFEDAHDAPAGWTIENIRGEGWTIGAVNNSSGNGPNGWHSGQNGAGIKLDGQYSPNSYAHLTSPEYRLPTNATSQLTFRQWICTESAWDGGAVSLSTDGGLNWWYLPADPGGFHDRISTVNSNSPFYGEGLLDGSRVTGGCHGVIRGFELKTADITNLSGESVRLRFSFFSDEFVERDGWYIDDAGIEISLFENEGEWVSEPFTPNPVFGYGVLDASAIQPENTTLRFSLMDSNGDIIPQYERVTAPKQILLNPEEYPSVRIVVHMSTTDILVTPTLERVGLGLKQTFGAYQVQTNSLRSSSNNLTVDSNGYLSTPASDVIINSFYPQCFWDEVIVTHRGNNVSVPTGTYFLPYNSYTLESSSYISQPMPTTTTSYSRVYPYGESLFEITELNFTLFIIMGDYFLDSTIQPICKTGIDDLQIRIGNNAVEGFPYPLSGNDTGLSERTKFHSVENDSFISYANEHGDLEWESKASVVYDLGYLGYGPNPSNMPQISGSIKANFMDQFVLKIQTGQNATNVTLSNFDYNGYQIYSVLASVPANTTQYVHVTSPGITFNSTHPNTFGMNYQTYWDWGRISMYLHTDQDTNLTAHSLRSSSSRSTFGAIYYTDSLLNSVLNASSTNDSNSMSNIPLSVETGKGGVKFNFTIFSEPVLIDTIVDAPASRWLPGTLREVTTHHIRTDPTGSITEIPALERINISMGPSTSQSDVRITAELDRLDTTPRFIQTSGAGIATLHPSSNALCTQSECTVTWVFESTWLNDDIDDVHWMAYAIDETGLKTGPAIWAENTAYNDVENDLEAFNVLAFDDEGRALHDWTQPLWPLHVNSDTEMTVSGRVRFEGVAERWVGDGEAQVSIEVRAIPPKNISGGLDEWPEEPIEWALSNTSEVDQYGRFSIPLTIPDADELVSGTLLEVRTIITRCGPVGNQANTAFDKTAESTSFEVLYDETPPDLISVQILDQSGLQPADGHIWMPDRPIPLRLLIQDGDGLETPLTIHTWSEDRDDANGNGLMEEVEYQSFTANINRGALEVEVDLPLLQTSDVLPPGYVEGRLSVVVLGSDLAGNALQGGGSYGEETDAATIYVQPWQPTLLDWDSLNIDTIDGHLFPGQTHHVSFDLIDGNGLSSLDSITLGLLDSQQDDCWIEYAPRFNTTTGDVTCFVAPPTVTAQKDYLSSRWTLTVSFQMRWDAMNDMNDQQFTPSIVVLDENQDVGLGASYLSDISWKTHTRLSLVIDDVSDRVAPFGVFEDDTLTMHLDDFADIAVIVVHEDTLEPALHIPFDSKVAWTVFYNADTTFSTQSTIDTTGLSSLRLVLNWMTIPNGVATLNIDLTGSVFNFSSPLSIQLQIDEQSPTMTLEPGTFNDLDSNDLNDVPITINVRDDFGVSENGAMIHWCYVRAGKIVEGSTGEKSLDSLGTTGDITSFQTILDVEQTGVLFEKSDRLSVWFSHQDRSGNAMVGEATEFSPLEVYVVWMAFEPIPISIEATPYRPSVGEIIDIVLTVDNIGYLNGSTSFILQDGDGIILREVTFNLEAGERESITWEIEAWTTGRLGMTLKMDNSSVLIPVPLADVTDDSVDQKSSASELGLNILLVILAAGAVVGTYLMRKQRIKDLYDEFDVGDDAIKPPPRPLDLMDIGEEE